MATVSLNIIHLFHLNKHSRWSLTISNVNPTHGSSLCNVYLNMSWWACFREEGLHFFSWLKGEDGNKWCSGWRCELLLLLNIFQTGSHGSVWHLFHFCLRSTSDLCLPTSYLLDSVTVSWYSCLHFNDQFVITQMWRNVRSFGALQMVIYKWCVTITGCSNISCQGL